MAREFFLEIEVTGLNEAQCPVQAGFIFWLCR